MSPERYVYEKAAVKNEAPSKKVEYTKPRNWAVANKNNNRLSNNQVWRR